MFISLDIKHLAATKIPNIVLVPADRRERFVKREIVVYLQRRKRGIDMDWLLLIVAGMCETGFAFCLGKGNVETGNKAAMWYVAFALLCLLSMVLLTKATKTIPLGTAYPVWTGIGAVGTVIVGILVFKEPASFWRLFFIFTLIASVVGLKIVH